MLVERCVVRVNVYPLRELPFEHGGDGAQEHALQAGGGGVGEVDGVHPHGLGLLRAGHDLAEGRDAAQEGGEHVQVDGLLVEDVDEAADLLALAHERVRVEQGALVVRHQVEAGPVAVRGDDGAVDEHDQAARQQLGGDASGHELGVVRQLPVLGRGRQPEPVAQLRALAEVVVQAHLGLLHRVLPRHQERLQPQVVFTGEVGQVGLGVDPFPQRGGVPLEAGGRGSDLLVQSLEVLG